jgi:predicted small lipoprotein YifL
MAHEMRRRIALIVALVLLALPLAACGKRGPLEPPANEPNVYPRVYPSE